MFGKKKDQEMSTPTSADTIPATPVADQAKTYLRQDAPMPGASRPAAPEITRRPPDLSAILKLQPAHRLGRTIKPRQIGEDHHRAIGTGSINGARHFLGRLREQSSCRPLIRPVGRDKSQSWNGAGLDADKANGITAEVRIPNDGGFRRPHAGPGCRPAR